MVFPFIYFLNVAVMILKLIYFSPQVSKGQYRCKSWQLHAARSLWPYRWHAPQALQLLDISNWSLRVQEHKDALKSLAGKSFGKSWENFRRYKYVFLRWRQQIQLQAFPQHFGHLKGNSFHITSWAGTVQTGRSALVVLGYLEGSRLKSRLGHKPAGSSHEAKLLTVGMLGWVLSYELGRMSQLSLELTSAM